jgi:hypothetical protein
MSKNGFAFPPVRDHLLWLGSFEIKQRNRWFLDGI